MKKDNLSIIIVEDHSIIVEGLGIILKNTPGISLDGIFSNAEDALAYLKGHTVNLVLLDISLPGMQGTEFCGIIKKQYETIKVVVLSNHTEKNVVQGMLANGADAYLLKNIAKQDLVTAVFQVMNGQFVMQAELQKILFTATADEGGVPRLTTREKEILQLVSQGVTTGNIAGQLFISRQTVETHRRNLMQKFDVNNSAALIRRATELGIL